ncbi:putative endonuclease 4 [Candidatus Izimaplasma bacterium HR1]|jgi:deoxyribonuclease-4|uniref:deoxyribonuclease IV n=1 Tax=Candidatus Izimoplasma sp. HR1 TaxID=1541959 RepID=UPI0004F59556|nr:putative endonuclease 4 [Candidatus Izimaplasma bacterium HR1]
MLKIGSHVSMNGKEMLVGSVKEALSYNANSFMIYTGAPQNTRRKPTSEIGIEEAFALMKEHNLSLDDVVVHAPYVMNLANGDPEKRQFAVDFLTSEIKRTAAIGAKQIVLHPGAHVKQGPEIGIKHIIEGLNKVVENTKDLNVLIALETMAGKGTEIGRNFEELKAIIDGVTNNERISVCFDTCHTHDAGYLTKDNFDKVIEDFDRIVGKERITVFHINDSKNVLGASKDRHENIGFGFIGFESLNYIVNHPDFMNVPKILETPYVTEQEDSKDKSLPPYKYEIEMFRKQIFNENIMNEIRNK